MTGIIVASSCQVAQACLRLFRSKKMVSIPTLNDDCILQEFSGTLISCWSKDLNNTREGKGVIPRSVRFTGKGENINVFGLELGRCQLFSSGVISLHQIVKHEKEYAKALEDCYNLMTHSGFLLIGSLRIFTGKISHNRNCNDVSYTCNKVLVRSLSKLRQRVG